MATALDLSDKAAVEAGVQATIDRFGGLDRLVSAAGIQHIEAIAFSHGWFMQ